MIKISDHLESDLWVFAVASWKWNPLINSIFFFLSSWLILNLVLWFHPGGPAWGKIRRRNMSNTIPGPKGTPILGSLNLMTGPAHLKLAAAAEAHQAKRLMAFSLGETRAVVTSHPDVAREILNSSEFVDRPANESAYDLMFNRSIGFAPYGVYWKTIRKISTNHLFCPKQLKAGEQLRLEIANQMVSSILASRKLSGFLVRDVIKTAALNNMTWSVFRRECCLDSNFVELKYLVDEGYDLLGGVNWSDHLSFLGELDLQKIRLRCSQLVPRVKKFVSRIIAEHKAAGIADSERGGFVDVLLCLKGDDRLSDDDMIALLWEMIFRGTDTVAVLVEWVLARLVLHRDVQAKIHKELDKVTSMHGVIRERDLGELVYLSAVINEVLRMHPPGPLLSWARSSIRDSIVDGYYVPARTTAMVNMWAIMRDPEFWDDPLRFEPDRFMNKRIMDDDLVVNSRLLAPFGLGRRSCPGKTLGLTTVKLWLARLLQEFEFESGDVDLTEVLRVSCEMRNPLNVGVRSRRHHRI